jgi:phosphoserine phosphatase RsbU/P
MKSKGTIGLYALLVVVATVSMVYYITGVLALREEFFHASRYARAPFDLGDDSQTLKDLRKEATSAGLVNGELLLAIDGVPFTGEAQIHDLLLRLSPGQIIGISARTPPGQVQEVQVRLAPREAPDWSLGRYIAFLTPILGVPLLGLLIGYWVVAARPRDLNAWLVLLLLAFPETAYGNLDWSFWPAPWYLVLGLWNSIVQIFVFPALLWFGFLFPERWRIVLRLPWFKYVILAVS